MASARLKSFLDKNDVKYLSIVHSAAYTAQEIAASAHISGKELAKTVIVKLDGVLAMVALPASTNVDFRLLKRVSGADEVELAHEAEFSDFFPECETGAMPPFGNLYQMRVFVDRMLADDEQIAFNAGTHTELIEMSYGDFERLVRPEIAQVSVQ